MATTTKHDGAAPRRLQTTWMVDRPKWRPTYSSERHTAFVARDGTGACAWASRREAVQAAEDDQGYGWPYLARQGWRIRRVTGIASELAR
jgi:hypothetical protein